ncbi:hypothetical protein OEZ85_014343 [Tetradesmus obliquus]|uniref:Uncharacterized protein n=1 Tax=Tetradesmus obliquus TaxID=3088 RepID=A0ABY8UCX8_TETOB|nr:hypothetical protein OEZ85_014343 [Tetradesmus obliquus]
MAWLLLPLQYAPPGLALFNPSVVQYGGSYYAATRSLQKKQIGEIEWWLSGAHLCKADGNQPSFKGSSCSLFDPWKDRNLSYRDCIKPPLKPGEKKPKKQRDAKGIEDPKLFVWPGKGVYATYNRKPHIKDPKRPLCDKFGFVQYMSTVVYDGEPPGREDPWHLQAPVQLSAGQFSKDIYKKDSRYVKEKNWMPFIHAGELFFTHSIMPHRVFKVNVTGIAVQQWVSVARELLPDEFLQAPKSHMHGGPPVVLVGSSASGTGKPYYLGVMHYWDMPRMPGARAYHHYAYQMEAQPPFRICAVSKELPLRRYDSTIHAGVKANMWTRDINFISGLQLVDDNKTVHMSYGAFDTDARMLSMTLTDLESHFVEDFDCSRSRVVKVGAGRGKPGKEAAAGQRGAAAADGSREHVRQ